MLLGTDDGGVSVCPQSWLERPRKAIAEQLSPLLELEIEHVGRGCPRPSHWIFEKVGNWHQVRAIPYGIIDLPSWGVESREPARIRGTRTICEARKPNSSLASALEAEEELDPWTTRPLPVMAGRGRC